MRRARVESMSMCGRRVRSDNSLASVDFHEHGGPEKTISARFNLLLHPDEGRAVRSDVRPIFVLVAAAFRASPKVAHLMFAAEAEVGPLCGDGNTFRSPVEQADSNVAAGQRLGPNLGGSLLRDAITLFSKFVLVDRDHFGIDQRVQR